MSVLTKSEVVEKVGELLEAKFASPLTALAYVLCRNQSGCGQIGAALGVASVGSTCHKCGFDYDRPDGLTMEGIVSTYKIADITVLEDE